MKLEQGQLWKKGDDYFRITEWARLAIEYKHMTDPTTKEGTLHQVTKKQFCRLLKGATIVHPDPTAEEEPETQENSDSEDGE